MKIQIKPYQVIENQNFDDAEVLISKDVFDGIEYQLGIGVFTFSNCRFQSLTIKNTEGIDFEDISMSFSFCQIKELEIIEIEAKNIIFNFHGSIVNGRIKSRNINSVLLNNCICLNLFLLNLENIHISYTDENVFVKNWIELLKPTGIKNLDELLVQKQNIYIYHSKSISVKFNHSRNTKKGIYRDSYSKIDYLKVRYRLSRQQKLKLNINLTIDFSLQEDKLLKIEDCILNLVHLKGTANGKISIEKSAINNLIIQDFSSEADMLLYNIYPFSKESKIAIHKSNMDNTWFDNIDLNGYKSLSFYRSRFAKAVFTSCNFPDDTLSFDKFKSLENLDFSDKTPQNYYKDQYETFLQLMNSFESSGNYYEAQKVGAISKESLRKIPTLSKGDKFILWAGSWSNNHGLSIKSPFCKTIILSFILYILYLCSIGRIFNKNEIDLNLIGYYFSFLDITHRTDFLVDKKELNGWSVTIEAVHKMVIGFLIYQFIAAFRKFGKK